jgi:hypothetical protein
MKRRTSSESRRRREKVEEKTFLSAGCGTTILAVKSVLLILNQEIRY